MARDEANEKKKINRSRRRGLRWILIIFVVPLFLPVIMFLLWWFGQNKPLRMFIMDKTSTTTNGQEHKSITWNLHYLKYCKDDDTQYVNDVDYFGFFPKEDKHYVTKDIEYLRYQQIDSLADWYDAVYFADFYGVYYNQWYYGEDVTDRRYWPGALLYGGMTDRELTFLKEMKERNKLIISEFNVFVPPTYWKVSEKWTEAFGIGWQNWTGRYYVSLDTTDNEEIPHWVIDSYLADHNNQWPWRKSGIIFLDSRMKVVVLEKDTHLNREVPYIISNGYMQREYRVPEEIKYSFWFNIVYSDQRNDVHAEFIIDVNRRGACELARHGIPTRFPAVIQGREYPRFFYFAADFADNPIHEIEMAHFRGIHRFRKTFYNPRIVSERREFFWEYYLPMFTRILNRYYGEYRRR